MRYLLLTLSRARRQRKKPRRPRRTIIRCHAKAISPRQKELIVINGLGTTLKTVGKYLRLIANRVLLLADRRGSRNVTLARITVTLNLP